MWHSLGLKTAYRRLGNGLAISLASLVRGTPRALGIRWSLLLGSALLLYFGAWRPLSAYFHARQADAALANHDCALARKHLEKYLAVWGRDARRHFELARCCWREGDPDAADLHLEEAARLGLPSKTVEIEQFLILAQQELTPPLEADLLKLLREAREQQDSELESIILEAAILAFVKVGSPTSVLLARRLAAMNSENWRCQRLLGDTLDKQERDEAARAYTKSVSLKHDQPKVHRWLALHYARRARPEKTLDHLRAAQPLPVDDVEAVVAEAKAHHLLGNFSRGRALLESAWTRGADRLAWAWTLRGRIELDEHGPSQAAPWLARAEALTPFHPDTLDALIALAVREGNAAKVSHYQQRKKDCEKAVEEFAPLRQSMDAFRRNPNATPEDRRALAFRTADLLLRTGYDDDAITWLQSIVDEVPTHNGANKALADYYERIGERTKAEQYRQKVAQSQASP